MGRRFHEDSCKLRESQLSKEETELSAVWSRRVKMVEGEGELSRKMWEEWLSMKWKKDFDLFDIHTLKKKEKVLNEKSGVSVWHLSNIVLILRGFYFLIGTTFPTRN